MSYKSSIKDVVASWLHWNVEVCMDLVTKVALHTHKLILILFQNIEQVRTPIGTEITLYLLFSIRNEYFNNY